MSDDPIESAGPMSAQAWEQRYVERTAGWDLGAAPPALQELLDGLGGPPRRVVVPGCGNGHDAVAWARAGHEVLAIDFAPSAVEGTRRNAEQAGVTLRVHAGDFFDLPRAFDGAFDMIWEQTCYCAIQPAQRDAYVQVCARLLKPDGQYAGLLWEHGKPGGPPFNITPADVRAHFERDFRIDALTPVAEAVPSRKHEFLVRMTRRPTPVGTG